MIAIATLSAAVVLIFFMCYTWNTIPVHGPSRGSNSVGQQAAAGGTGGGRINGDLTSFLNTPYVGIDLPPPPAVFVNEMLSVFHSDKPEPTGEQASAWAMKTRGRHYQAVQANIVVQWNGVEKLLLSRRSKRKWVWPNALDFAVAETMLPGETYHQAIVRGVQEEFGIDVGGHVGETEGRKGNRRGSKLPLRVVSMTPLHSGVPTSNCWQGRMPHMLLFDCAWSVSFQVVLSGDIVHAVHLQKEEVAGMVLVDYRQANLLVKQTPNNFTHWFIDAVYRKKIPGFEPVQRISERCSFQCLGNEEKQGEGAIRGGGRGREEYEGYLGGDRIAKEWERMDMYDACQAECIKAMPGL